MWPITLSGRLSIVALVGRYPANKLMERGLIPKRQNSQWLPAFDRQMMSPGGVIRY